ncbi:integrase core domain-containing protein [Ideonella sp. 4Y16]|uniref:Integrase core domain-containing protein n=1 Tax=Ideonella alba TaxID=2824118 RepID=A0A940YJ66_9BURK|nr:integrase core domain-containing protein [Ideonella alba]MBQ0946370.1 integrase core domain-containing protein [Ideonella alba]
MSVAQRSLGAWATEGSTDNERRKIHEWGHDYNEHRPHSSLGHLTQREFIEQGQDNPSPVGRLLFKPV